MNTEAHKNALLARTSTPTLLDAALKLEAKGQLKSPEERMTAAWIYDELEARAGHITNAESVEFDQIFDESGSLITALLVMRPKLYNM